MPCDTIQTSNVEFNLTNTDYAMLREGMMAIGYASPVTSSEGTLTFYRGRNTAEFKNGKLKLTFSNYTGETESGLVNEIKRAYSTQVVRAASKKYGWTIKEKTPGKFAVQKRK